jgi:hypothetical protein
MTPNERTEKVLKEVLRVFFVLLILILFVGTIYENMKLKQENEMLKDNISRLEETINKFEELNWTLKTKCNTKTGFVLAYFESNFKFETDYFSVLNRTINDCEVLK